MCVCCSTITCSVRFCGFRGSRTRAVFSGEDIYVTTVSFDTAVVRVARLLVAVWYTVEHVPDT